MSLSELLTPELWVLVLKNLSKRDLGRLRAEPYLKSVIRENLYEHIHDLYMKRRMKEINRVFRPAIRGSPIDISSLATVDEETFSVWLHGWNWGRRKRKHSDRDEFIFWLDGETYKQKSSRKQSAKLAKLARKQNRNRNR